MAIFDFHTISSKTALELANSLLEMNHEITGVCFEEGVCLIDQYNGNPKDIQIVGNDFYKTGEESVLRGRLPDVTIHVPTFRLESSWEMLNDDELELEMNSAFNDVFSQVKSISKEFMLKRSRGVMVLTPPEPKMINSITTLNSSESIKIRRCIIAEGLYALTKSLALELAAKKVRVHFVDISRLGFQSSAELITWLSSNNSNYMTGCRFPA